MIEIMNLQKTYVSDGAPFCAVDGISLKVPEGSFFTLLGPSGCGKSTTLRCVAGLETPDGGTIRIRGETVFSSDEKIAIPTFRRDIGMVFQSYAIWPHMTVFENVAYPLRVKGMTRAEVRRKVDRALAAVGLAHLANRPAPHLSGGQQQRVSLARALVREPKALLLDEPLSNLDAKLREQMRIEIKRLQSEFGITTLYVTHDQTEALAISDHIAVMSSGKILDLGGPRDIYFRPSSGFTADFVGLANRFNARVTSRGGLLGQCDSVFGALDCVLPQTVGSDDVTVFVRPEDVMVSRTRPTDGINVLEGVITELIFLGETLDCHIAVGSQIMRAHVHAKAAFACDEHVFLQAAPESLILVAS